MSRADHVNGVATPAATMRSRAAHGTGFLVPALILLATLGAPSEVAGQTLTLAEALARAERGAYANRSAEASTSIQAGQALTPLRGVLPTVRLEGGYLRTTDPLAAFGFTLRQRSVTAASFIPSALNNPAPIGNMTTGLVMELPLLNPDAWYGRTAGVRSTNAARAAEGWTRAGTGYDVVQAYYGAVLAEEQIITLDSAVLAAQGHVRQAESLVEHGLVTRSDALLASVKAGEVEVQLIAAKGDADLAKRELAVLMGDPADTAFTLPSVLPSADRVQALGTLEPTDTAPPVHRGDVEAAHYALEAADADVQRATSLYLPRLNSFGRLDWNDPNTPFGGKDSWTVGVMLSWSPFTGGSQVGEHRVAEGRRVEARAQAEAALALAELEAARAQNALSVALARIDITARAVAQSAEAHRIIARKYEGGLASVVDLLDAAAVETQSRLSFAQARYEALVAAARWRRARGTDLGALVELGVSTSGDRSQEVGS